MTIACDAYVECILVCSFPDYKLIDNPLASTRANFLNAISNTKMIFEVVQNREQEELS